mgnify:FL=1
MNNEKINGKRARARMSDKPFQIVRNRKEINIQFEGNFLNRARNLVKRKRETLCEKNDIYGTYSKLYYYVELLSPSPSFIFILFVIQNAILVAS